MNSSVELPQKIQLPSDQNASGRDLGDDEMVQLGIAIESGTLNSTKGRLVKQFEQRFADYLDISYAFACSSGSAAIHCALAAINPEPGDEVVTTSITDMGAITPILYQGAIPVFADVDPLTYNLTAEKIEAALSERTKAIIVTHLFGNPTDMDDVLQLARSQGIPVIEDCAQAFGSEYRGHRIGTLGDISCFSLQQGKHITTGEGGLVATKDEHYARRINLFINKAWGYGDPQPDHYFLALNYRMNELTGAVAMAQLNKLSAFVEKRIAIAQQFTEWLAGIDGIDTPLVTPHSVHSYWKYCLRVDSSKFAGGLDELAKRLKDRGIFCAPRYIQKPAFECEVIRDQRTFGKSRFPFTLARPAAVDYSREKFAGTFAALASVLVLPLNERYTSMHVQYVINSIRQVAAELQRA
jgi:perosamine synthetase